ncbi:hypothetical protein [Idiomarina xiamenensis]|uniref:Lipoprotein n=1 Tax=Idiomarina xiamenensis 10-D-4 TaxID=740709 RepID=K2K2L1_9GAMM|nr:hypothetical protein [Idiomarina xiamenensis]EKE80917.1 hypothetical protein A10D4_11034 [Idiomarina xiamenensis 10-D-4]
MKTMITAAGLLAATGLMSGCSGMQEEDGERMVNDVKLMRHIEKTADWGGPNRVIWVNPPQIRETMVMSFDFSKKDASEDEQVDAEEAVNAVVDDGQQPLPAAPSAAI